MNKQEYLNLLNLQVIKDYKRIIHGQLMVICVRKMRL